MAGLIFDTGVLIAADRNDRRAWAWRTEALERRGIVPSVPTPVIVQAWRGSENANLARFLRGCKPEPLLDQLARAAGELCGSAKTSDVVDAVVMAVARPGDTVVTTDPDDLNHLAEYLPGVRVVPL